MFVEAGRILDTHGVILTKKRDIKKVGKMLQQEVFDPRVAMLKV